MKAKLTLFNVAAVLAALLLAAIAVLFTDQTASNSWPSITSPRPSGTMAFAELLRREGYNVVLDRSARPGISKDDLAIAFFIADKSDFASVLTQSDEDSGFNPFNPNQAIFAESMTDHVAGGGSLLYLPMPSLFDAESKGMRESTILTGPRNQNYKARWENFERYSIARQDWSEGDYEGILWADPNGYGVILMGAKGKARIGVVSDAMMASNRYLDKEDHAALLLDTVARLAKPGAKVVFTEAAFGNVESRSLFGSLGSWAQALRIQALLLGLVIVYTLGKRFGQPEVEFQATKGARDMLTALSATMRSGKRRHLALHALYDDAIAQCRKIVRATRSMSDADVIARLPIELQNALMQIQRGSWQDAVAAAKMLDFEMAKFKADSRQERPRA